MAKLPAPPAGGLALPAITTTLAVGTILWRIYSTGGAHPATWSGLRFFGPTHARFDHHDPPAAVQAKGILYAARAPLTCFAEFFQATRTIDRGRGVPWLVGFELARAVVVLDLTGLWPTRAGASMAINSGQRPRARQWSRAIYAAYANVGGLLYASSMHSNQPAVALYERAQGALPGAPVFNRALADPALHPRLAGAATGLPVSSRLKTLHAARRAGSRHAGRESRARPRSVSGGTAVPCGQLRLGFHPYLPAPSTSSLASALRITQAARRRASRPR